MSSSTIPYVRLALPVPLYACDWDPSDPNKLVVGGGGGPGRSGVGNKIIVLSLGSPDGLQISGEIALSSQEDSVNSLAVGQRKGRSTLVYAGINSDPEEVRKGKNEHFRVFGVEQSKAQPAKISELVRASLFSASHPDKYQRKLRLAAPSQSGAQLGAVASGLGNEHQICVFDVSASSNVAPKSRGTLSLEKEANDIDVIQTGEDQYQLAYCDNYELHVMALAKSSTESPKLVFTIPHDESSGAPTRPSFRFIRYLTPSFLLAVANLPKRGGVVLQAFRLPRKDDEMARLAASVRLPRSVAQATAMAVRNLSPPVSPGAKMGQTQFLIAVAGHDSSVSLYTLGHQSDHSIDILYDLLPLRVLKDVHPLQITALAFSVFTPPSKPSTRQQVVNLASISMGHSVVVHSIPLKKFVDRPARPGKRLPRRPARYVAAMKSRQPSTYPLAITLTIIGLIMAILGRLIVESYGTSRPILSRFINPFRAVESMPGLHNEFLNSLLSDIKATQGDKIVLREEKVSSASSGKGDRSQLQVDVHDEEVHGQAKTWEELPPKQRNLWRAKLKEAGHWAEGMGDSVFKGILFGELAGAVGRAVGG